MAESVATRVARHRAKQRASDVTRLTIELSRDTISNIRRLSKKHRKTQRQFLELAVHAADGLLAGRLAVSKAAAQPPACVISRPTPQGRAKAPDQTASNTNTPAPPENTPTASQQPEGDNADARIRACAFAVET
ncbi:hypothetical protein [Rhodocyclus purpureus]|uniref:hypothetical protein n=1 Tax=Rhodocyclus purpureus TaxID=1067 RepID=UPI00191158ED|nr:hypothetical protein [Rhodocyclus purpureus]